MIVIICRLLAIFGQVIVVEVHAAPVQGVAAIVEVHGVPVNPVGHMVGLVAVQVLPSADNVKGYVAHVGHVFVRLAGILQVVPESV